MVDLFGTYAGMYDSWQASEDGLIYDGIRRHGTYQAVGSSDGHWIVEPDVAKAAVTAAQIEFGVEGDDTRWAVDGTQVLHAPPQSGPLRPVDRDDQGRYLLPRSEFPDAGQARRGMEDRITGIDDASIWGIGHDQKAPPVTVTADVQDRTHAQDRPC